MIHSAEYASILNEQCLVCGEKAFTKNFGVLVCRACAVHHKIACKYCRLQRCVEVGMCICSCVTEFVCRLDEPAREIVHQLDLFRKLFFVNRTRMLLSFGWTQRYSPMITSDSIVVCIQSEWILARDCFLRIGVPLKRLIRPDLGLDDVAFSFFLYWKMLEIVITTARNKGHLASILYWLDDSHIEVSLEACDIFWEQFREIGDTKLASRLGISWMRSALNVASLFYASDFDSLTTSVLMALMFNYYGANPFQSSQTRSDFVGCLLNQLRECFHEDELAVQFGKMALFLGEFYELCAEYVKCMICYDLMYATDIHRHLEIECYRQWRDTCDRLGV